MGWHTVMHEWVSTLFSSLGFIGFIDSFYMSRSSPFLNTMFVIFCVFKVWSFTPIAVEVLFHPFGSSSRFCFQNRTICRWVLNWMEKASMPRGVSKVQHPRKKVFIDKTHAGKKHVSESTLSRTSLWKFLKLVGYAFFDNLLKYITGELKWKKIVHSWKPFLSCKRFLINISGSRERVFTG